MNLTSFKTPLIGLFRLCVVLPQVAVDMLSMRLSTIFILPSSTLSNQDTLSETRPLLSRPDTPQHASYLQSPANPHVNVSPQSVHGVHFPSASQWAASGSPSASPRLHDLGWIEYVLPDATFYYVHPTLRVTTDIDLRRIQKLEAVTAYFDRQKDIGDRRGSQGTELWLREMTGRTTKRRGDVFTPVKSWVDHRKRTVVVDNVWEGNGAGPRKGKAAEEDGMLHAFF